MSTNLAVSIITVHFQDYARLQHTWESLQPWLDREDIEWLVIDGESKTSTSSEQDLLREFEQEADVYIPRPDSGIYDAMNKGMRLANGQYFLFLNAGDRLSSGFSPQDLIQKAGAPYPDMIWGNTNYEYSDNTHAVKKLRTPGWMVYGMPVCHQSIMFRTKYFANFPYNLDYLIAADYELLARALKAGASTLLVDEIISEYAAGGLSQSDQWLSLAEESRVRVEHYGVPILLSKLLAFFKLGLWKLNDFSPAFNKLWRRAI